MRGTFSLIDSKPGDTISRKLRILQQSIRLVWTAVAILYFFQMKTASVGPVGGEKVEEYRDIATRVVSLEKGVFVYVVPDGAQWRKANRLRKGRAWLKGASVAFISTCDVCVIGCRSTVCLCNPLPIEPEVVLKTPR